MNPILKRLQLTVILSSAVALNAPALNYTWDGVVNHWNTMNWNGATASGPTTAGNTATINSGTVWAGVYVGAVDSITVGAGGQLDVWNGAYQGLGNLILQGGTFYGSGSYNAYGAGVLGNLTVSGSAASTITGSSWFNLGSSTTFTVADATGSSASDLLVNLSLRSLPGSPDYTYLYNSKIIKEGAGTMEVTVHSYFNGGLDLNGGTLKLSGGNGGYGFFASAVNVNSGTTLETISDGTGLGWQSGWKPSSVNINGGTVTTAGASHIWGISGGINMTGGTLQSNGGVSSPSGGQLEWNYTDVITNASASSATIGGRIRIRDDGGYSGISFNVADGSASSDLVVSAAVTEASGGRGITKSGAGTMTLTGVNNYTGNTTINGGTLKIAEGASIYNGGWNGSAVLTVNNGATLELNRWGYGPGGANQSLGGLNYDPARFVINGGTVKYTGGAAGAPTDPGESPYGPGFTIGALGATLDAAKPGDTWTVKYDSRGYGPITSNAGGTLTLTGIGNGVFDKELGGAGGVVMNGSATWTLNRNNTYAGVTTVNTGTLALGSTGALTHSTLDTGTSGSQNVTFVVPGVNTYEINGLAGSDALYIGANSLNLGELGATASYSGVLDGSGNLIKRGSGTQTLSGANSFSGSVTVQQGGTLSVPTAAASGNQPLGTGTGSISVESGSTLAITGAGSYNLPSTRGLALSGSGGILNVSAGTVNMSGGITGNATFTKAGAGTFNFSGSGSWSGDFTVSAGTFNLTGGGSIPGVGVTSVSGALNINTTGLVQTSSLDILSGGTVNLDAGTLRVGGGGLGLTGRSIDNSGGSFNWGNGTLAVYTTGTGEAGLTDRTGAGGSPSGPAVKEGNYLSVAGDLNAAAGSTLDLGSTYLSNGLRYNQLNVNGNLALNDGTLNIGLSPYFLRPNTPDSVIVGDWGTMVLVYAEGTLSGTFAQLAGKTVIPGISNDGIGWTQMADLEYTGGPTFDPANLGMNQWLIEYRDGSGGNDFNFTQSPGAVVLLHYKVAGSVPEPASAGLLVAGTLLLRALRRRAG